MNEKFWLGVVQAIVVALLLGIGATAWETYQEVVDLRHDVNVLYGMVNELAQRED